MTNGVRPSPKSIARGKALYDSRIKYPLPEVDGVQDYIFYYDDDSDGYIQGARGFLSKVYPRHEHVRNVRSLSQVIDRLHTDITAGRTQRPREIVLVGHASPHAIKLKIMSNPPANLEQDFRLTSALSLFELQKAVRAGGNQDIDQFEQRRRIVVERLTDESWVVLRACRFGQNKKGLFALFSFFGGRANAYAAHSYTFFTPVAFYPNAVSFDILDDEPPEPRPPRRFESRAEVYEHMASQRLVSPLKRTPERKLSLVNLIAEPGHATRDASVRTANLSQDGPDRDAYLADVASLDAGNVPASVSAELQAAFGITLDEPRASFRTEENQQALNATGERTFFRWRFRDKVSNEFNVFEAELNYRPSNLFQLEIIIEDLRSRAIGGADEAGEIVTSAKLIARDTPIGESLGSKTEPNVPIQLFLEDHDYDPYKGFYADLARRATENPDAEELAEFEEVKTAIETLAQGPDPDPAARLAEVLAARTEIDGDPATLSVTPAQPAGEEWGVEFGGTRLAIGLEIESDTRGRRTTRLRLSRVLGARDSPARRAHEAGFINDYRWGTNSDIPGVEIMAWLDHLSIGELKDLIDFLDSVQDFRRVRLAHTWRHAVDALGDKHPSRHALGEPDTNDPLFGVADSPYNSGYSFEKHIGAFLGEANTSYVFPSRRFWTQAKEIFIVDPPVQTDLFQEQTLPTPPDYLRQYVFEVDSPDFDPSTLTPREREIYDSLTADRKFGVVAVPAPAETECEAFRRWAVELSQLSQLSEDEIDAAIAQLPVIDRPQDGNALKLALKVLKTLNTFLEKPPTSQRIVAKLSARFVRLGNIRIFGLTATQAVGAFSFLSVIYFVGNYFLRNLLADITTANNNIRDSGVKYAYRHYAVRLYRKLRAHGDDFPTTLDIDIRPPPGTDLGDYATNVARALNRESNSYHFNNLFFGHKDFLGEGYIKGVELVENAAQRALDDATLLFNRGLRKAGLKQCMIDALEETGLVTPGRVRAVVMRQVAEQIDRASRPATRGE